MPSKLISFPGTATECGELMAALARNCCCQYDADGYLSNQCPGHTALGASPAFVLHLLFARTLRIQIMAEEGL